MDGSEERRVMRRYKRKSVEGKETGDGVWG